MCWWYDFDKKLVFDVPVDRIVSVNTEMRKTSGLDSKKEKVLDILYEVNLTKRTASFAGKEIDEWAESLNRIISGKIGEETETCPQCGKPALAKELLEEGCSSCGWVSTRLKKKIDKSALLAE